jgi:hypothetical protein
MVMNKFLIGLGALVGGIAGAYIPVLWGDNDLFSGMSILLSTVGGIIGIIVGFKLAQRFSD